MKMEENIRQDHILDAAIRRFSHFGIRKTTLTEIADDLSLTKQGFAYYFHDKASLVTAVAEKIMNEYLERLQSAFEKCTTTMDALYQIIEVRKEYFRNYRLLALQDIKVEFSQFKLLYPVINTGRSRQLKLVASLLAAASARGEILVQNPTRTAKVLLETLSSIEHSTGQKSCIPDENEFKRLFEFQKEVLTLFFTGLRPLTDSRH